MSDLPRFELKRPCPKCSHDVTEMLFFNARDTLPGWGDKTPHERIAKKCKRCNYVWNELPLDYEDDDAEADP